MSEAIKRKSIHVVAAIIYDASAEKILLAKRPAHLHKGGYWEFPGGKLELGETELEALARELKEELDLSFTRAVHFERLEYDYPEKSVALSFWQVTASSKAKALEGQELAWVSLDALGDYRFPEANEPVVKKLLQAV